MNKLMELHDLIKDHPYRLPSVTNNDAYKSSYVKLYRKLLDGIYKCADNEEFEPIVNKGVKAMYHDVMSATCHISNGASDSNDCVIFLEMMLSIIHVLLETGKLPYYYALHKSKPIQIRLTNDWKEYHPYFKDKNKYLELIKEIEEKWIDRDLIHNILDYYQRIYDNYDEYFGEVNEG